MSDASPRKPPSRTSSQIPSSKPKTGPTPKQRAPDSNPKARQDLELGTPTGRDDCNSSDSRSRQRGDDKERPAERASSPEPAKKHVVRLTLTEASEEIKRLRRLERQNITQMKKYEEQAQAFMQEITNLKQQIADSGRVRMEEKAAMMSMYENDTTKLKNELKVTGDELRELQETSLPLVEARKLTFKALRKGRALQYMAQLYTNNTVLMTVKREALHKLLENAVGTDHATFRATHGFACGVQAYTDSHLRLLRQEQLILLAENERLQSQIQDMQQKTENRRRERMLQHELALVGRDDNRLLEQSGSSSRSVGQAAWQRGRFVSHGMPSSVSMGTTNMKARDLERELARTKLQSIAGVLCMGKTRLLAYGFRRLFAYSLNECVVQTMETAISRNSLASKKEAIITGSSLVMSFVRTCEKALKIRAFWIVMLNAKAQSYAEEIRTKTEKFKQQQQQASTSDGPGYPPSTCRACHAWTVLSSELDQTTGSTGRPSESLHSGGSRRGFGLAPSQGGGIPPPVAYAPHYFRDLPSAQKRRNMYFTTTPPRIPQQNFPTTAQRAREMVSTQETLYRPMTAVEGWQQPGGNGLGIAMEPMGNIVTSPVASQDAKLDAARCTLKATMTLPSASPSSQPLSTAERNDAYMRQMLRATDERLKMQ